MTTEKSTYLDFMQDLGDASDEFKDFILKMLHNNPQKRLTNIEEIKQHPWYQGPTLSFKKAILEVNAALLKTQ